MRIATNRTLVPDRRANLRIAVNTLLGQSKRRIMKNATINFAVLVFMAGTLLTGCRTTSEQKADNAEEDVRDAKEELREARAEYRAEWRAFRIESEQKIEANEKKIEAFKERMENAGPERKAKYGRRVADLEQKNRDLRRNLAEYRDEGRSRWEQFKSNFKRDMDGIGETMNDLFKSND